VAEIRVCGRCGSYTMSETCPGCGGRSRTAHPARFSPDDRYGKYRRIGIEEEYGENGKYRGGAQ